MQGYDGAIQAWLANLISRRVAPYFMTIRPCRGHYQPIYQPPEGVYLLIIKFSTSDNAFRLP